MVLGLRLVWGWESQARLRAIRSQFVSTGLPLTTASFAMPPLPDEQNAALALTTALQNLHIDPSEFSGRTEGRMRGSMGGGGGWGGWGGGRGGPGERGVMDMSRWRLILAANQQSLADIDRALALPHARWPLHAWPLAIRPGTSFMGNFSVRMLLRAAAQIAHDDGHEPQALAAVSRMLALAKLLDSSNDLYNHVTAAGLRSEAAQLVERWNLQPTPATTTTLRELLAAMTEASRSSSDIERSFEYETAAFAESAVDTAPALQNWWLQPLAVDAVARGLAAQVRLLPVVRAHNWQQVAAVSLPSPMAHTNLNIIVLGLSEPRLEVVEVMRIYFRALADTRAVSVLTAAALYQADTGHAPATLEALVPAYLPAPPIDPFDAESHPLHYRLDGGEATVWSVGENGVDDGGKVAWSPPPTPSGTTTGTGGGWVGGRGFGFGGPGGGWGGVGRRYGQLDMVYGAAWRLASTAAPATTGP